MTQIDQFESVFKSADKAVFRYEPVEMRRVLLVTDLDEIQGRAVLDQVKPFLSVLFLYRYR